MAKTEFTGLSSVRVGIPIGPGDPRIMYVIIPDLIAKEYADLLKVRPTEKFFGMVREQVVANVVEGTQPPAAIATAISNIADDMMSGRDMVIRAGDYIALMDFARTQKIL